MDALLKKYTDMKIMLIEDGMQIKPNRNVIIFIRTLQLTEPIKTPGISLPIDHFFRSLSDDQK